jgi:hypothetical protein
MKQDSQIKIHHVSFLAYLNVLLFSWATVFFLLSTPSHSAAAKEKNSTFDGLNHERTPAAAVPPLWDGRIPNSSTWTTHSYSVINKFGMWLERGSSDIESFCPNYYNLSSEQKSNFWVYLVSAVVRFESNFRTTHRYRETTLGTDPITKEPVYSEGLLQLSYQDKLAYPFCDEFDWARDRWLCRTDPSKSIFDPFKNLRCGIRILNWQVQRFDLIAVDRGQYWAVLKPSSRFSRLNEIRQLTASLPFCRDHSK